MKKLITTYPGGFPLTLDRVRWMEDGINEAILALCRSLLPTGATSMILEGCEISETSQDHFNVSPGWIYLGGGWNKICKVSSHSFTVQNGSIPFPITGTTPRWVNTLDIDPSGNVTFFNGDNNSVHRIRHASVQISGDELLPAVASVYGKDGMWVQGTSVSTRKQGDILQIRGRYFGLGPIFNEIIPVEHRPANDVRVPIAAFFLDAGKNYTPLLSIKANGQVTIIDMENPSQEDVMYYINLSIPI